MLGLGIVLMIVALVLAVAGIRNLQERRSAEFYQCERVQDLRDDLNFANGIIYAALGTIELGTTATPRQRFYRYYGSRVKYSLPTNCTRATDDPNVYLPPPPIPYKEYLKRGGKAPVPLPPKP